MTRHLPSDIRRVGDLLASREGYLWSTFRRDGVTCQICTTPTGGTRLCDQCATHLDAPFPTADQTALLIYAPYDEQSYRVVKNYKAAAPGPSLGQVMSSLLVVGLRGHLSCTMHLAATADMAWAVVPSTKQPPRPQRLRELVQAFARAEREVMVSPAKDIDDPRAFNPEHFTVAKMRTPPDSVLVIDDSWVSGGHAHSVAAALKLAGVRHVSLFVTARVLDPRWAPTAKFLKDNRQRAFEAARCPWTPSGVCPL